MRTALPTASLPELVNRIRSMPGTESTNSWPSTSRIRGPVPLAMNGGYGFQPNFTVRALLPAPPGITVLASANSSPERFAQAPYRSLKLTRAHSFRRDLDRSYVTSITFQLRAYTVYSAY